MGLLTEINVSNQMIQLEDDDKEQSPSSFNKPAIQEKMEGWHKKTPCMDSLQSRLVKATNRRQTIISKIAQRATAHCNGVKNVLADCQNQRNAEVDSIKERVSAKNDRATKQMENRKHRYSQVMQRKMHAIARVKENAQLEQHELNEKIEKRLLEVTQRKEQILEKDIVGRITEENRKKVMKLEQLNKAVDDKIHQIEASCQNKLLAADERKKENLNNLSQNAAHSTKKRRERATLHKLSQDADLSNAQRRLEDRLLTANDRKELNVAARAAKAAEDNKTIAARVEEVQRKRESAIQEIQCKHENKLESAVKRKMRMDENKSSPSTTEGKLERARLHKLSMNADLSAVQRTLDNKLITAIEKKEITLAAKAAKAAEDNKVIAARVEEVQRKRESVANEIQCKHISKLESAAKRKELAHEKVSTTEGKLERARLFKLAQDADQTSAHKKIEHKILIANERKEHNIAVIVAKAAEGNKTVTARVEEVQKKRESTVNEIQCKHVLKLESATKRKEKHQEVDSVKRENVNLRRQKALQTFEKRQNIELPKAKQSISIKLDEASARREKILNEKVEQAGNSMTPRGKKSQNRSSELLENEECFEVSRMVTNVDEDRQNRKVLSMWTTMQMLSVAIFANIVNFLKGIFRLE